MSVRSTPPSLSVPIVLVACTWVSVLSTDLYTPSLPHLPELLGTTDQAAKYTLSFNLAAFALAQLLHGPLADRFGRRTMLVAGMASYSAASVICALAFSIQALIVGRTLQGLLSSVPSVVVLLLIHEMYGRGMAVRILGFHGMAVGIAPIVGPLIGGYVFVMFGWQANFWLLAGFASMVSVAAFFKVPETLKEPVPLRYGPILSGYTGVLGGRQTLSHLFPLSATFGALFAFVTSGPFLLIGRYGVATEAYGFYFGMVIIAVMLGGIMANRLGGRVDTRRLQLVAMAFTVIGVAVLGGSVMLGRESLVTTIGAVTVFAVGLGLMNATAPLLLLESVGDLPKSTASSVSGSAQLVAASTASFIVGAFHNGSTTPLAVTMAAFVVFGVIAHFVLYSDKSPIPTPVD